MSDLVDFVFALGNVCALERKAGIYLFMSLCQIKYITKQDTNAYEKNVLFKKSVLVPHKQKEPPNYYMQMSSSHKCNENWLTLVFCDILQLQLAAGKSWRWYNLC